MSNLADNSEIRFLNSSKEGNRINGEVEALQFIEKAKFNGGTPLGTSLDKRILQPLLINPVRKRSLKKPLLVIIITDGEPQGEDPDTREHQPGQLNPNCSRQRYHRCSQRPQQHSL